MRQPGLSHPIKVIRRRALAAASSFALAVKLRHFNQRL
jgi:hypothetical protein